MSTRNYNSHKSSEKPKQLPQKRTRRVVDDDTSDVESDTMKREVKVIVEPSTIKRQKKLLEGRKPYEMGADTSSPDKQPSTKQSEDDEEQLINSVQRTIH